MSNQSFKALRPINPFLHKYIDYYYFDEAGKKDPITRFTYFPHYKHAVTIYHGSRVKMTDLFTSSCVPSDNNFCLSYTNLVSHFARNQMHPPFKKIGIVFQPLGLNHFIKDTLSELLPTTFNFDIDLFQPEIASTLQEVFANKSLNENVNLLDEFFIDNFIGFEEEKLTKAIRLIHESPSGISVNELSIQLGINRKTLLRLFKRHLNSSVKDYLKLIKFRNAVDLYQSTEVKGTLTHLAYDMNYNDQSEFTHHFKNLTGFSPKSFFKNLDTLSDLGTYWSNK